MVRCCQFTIIRPPSQVFSYALCQVSQKSCFWSSCELLLLQSGNDMGKDDLKDWKLTALKRLYYRCVSWDSLNFLKQDFYKTSTSSCSCRDAVLSYYCQKNKKTSNAEYTLLFPGLLLVHEYCFIRCFFALFHCFQRLSLEAVARGCSLEQLF